MRIIDPTHTPPSDCFIKDLLPGDVFESLGFHWLRTADTDNSYIRCACLENGRLELMVSNKRVKPVFIKAVIE